MHSPEIIMLYPVPIGHYLVWLTEVLLSLYTRSTCPKVHQHTTPCKCLLNCSPAPHQTLIGGENQEDQEAAGCVVFSMTYISLHKRPGQRLMIAKDGERNGPLLTTRSDDDDDIELNVG